MKIGEIGQCFKIIFTDFGKWFYNIVKTCRKYLSKLRDCIDKIR